MMDVTMTPCNEVCNEINDENEDDALTNLPKEIRTHILSFLPTKDAIRTSILSSNWEHIWKYVNNLEFDDQLRYHHKGKRVHFIDFVYNVLMVSECKTLNSFFLSCSEFLHPRHVETWITTAMKRGVKNLTMIYGNPNMVFPRHFLTCEKFRKLDMDGSMTLKVPRRVSYPNLTELHLSHVRVRNEENSLKEIVLTFPALRVLHLYLCKWHHVKAMKIYTNALVYFMMSGSSYKCECCESIDCKVEMYGSKLFITQGEILEKFVLQKPELVVDAEFGQQSYDIASMRESSLRAADILSKFSNLTTLKLSIDIIEATRVEPPVTYPLMDKVKGLQICSGRQKLSWRGALMGLLKSLPKLEVLHFRVFAEYWNVDANQDIIFETPNCISSSLQVVAFDHFGASGSEIGLVKVFLEDGLVLKEVSIVTSSYNQPLLENVLLSVPKASNEAAIVFNFIQDSRKRRA